jgi:hypothetical protein
LCFWSPQYFWSPSWHRRLGVQKAWVSAAEQFAFTTFSMWSRTQE